MCEPLISIETREALDRLAQRLHAAGYGPRWPVPLKVVKAYVLAVHMGEEPVRAIGRELYGADRPLFERDTLWLRPRRREISPTHACQQFARACAGMRFNIPLAQGVRA